MYHRISGAHCLPRRSAAQTGAEPILRARPTGNTGNTKNTGVSTRKRVSHVPWNFRSTWLTVCYRQSIVFPVFIVFIVGLAPTLCIAPCALPANRTHSPVLSKFQSAWYTGCHRPFTVFPVFAVFMVSLFPPCALRNVLCQPEGMCFAFFGRHAQGARGETSLFPPCPPPFAPCVVERPAARNAASLS